MIDWDKYPNFQEYEFACRCCGEANMSPEFLETLQRLRNLFDRPMVISSGFRCADHNRAVGGGAAHPLGKAADIRVAGPYAWDLLTNLAGEFSGIGINQKGRWDKRFIHLDTCTAVETVRPRIWSY